MFENLMFGVAGTLLLASFITVSPTLCILAMLISVFGMCQFYQEEK